ncbi:MULTISPECIES: DUF3152 domain-containing protein [Nonomuraea]|uniref:DUF3152 domain-containing protein n=1 Tax=Nonomuraea mangrovi TaxID=2316207 RepID=A0ABW4TDA8_9ACTN
MALGVVFFLLTECGAPAAVSRVEPPPPTPEPAEVSRAGARPPAPKAASPPRLVKAKRPVKVPDRGSGRYRVVAGGAAPRKGRGAAVRYQVEVEGGLPFSPQEFAASVHATLNDPRSWGRFRRVDHGPTRLSVALTSPLTTDAQCLPLRTGGELSCWNGRRSVINAVRWARGVESYRGDLTAYRQYVINHEVGHGLGHHHVGCPGRGRPAPVMVQQSKSLESCLPNPWPYPSAGER